MHPITSHHTTVDGLDLHWTEAGSGPPVLLLHGWPTHSGLYRHALPKIAPHRRAIALDLPGFGQSSKSLKVSYSFRFYERILDGFLEHLEIETTGLVVHDLGGPIGLYWALHNQERLTDLTLLNTLVYPEMSPMVMAFVASARMPILSRLLTTRFAIGEALRFGMVNKHLMEREDQALYQDPFEDLDAREALRRTAYGLHPEGFQTLGSRIHELDCPVRLIYGEKDRILPRVRRTMERVADELPQAELTSIPDCGHFLQEDQPDEVASLLADFLARSV